MGHPREQLARLAGHVPLHALVSVLEQPERDFPALERREGTLLRLELFGVAGLADALYSRGRSGAVEMSQVLSRFLEGFLDQALRPAQGFLLRFSGESLTAFFEGPDAARRAAWCARELLQQVAALGDVHTGAGVRAVRGRAGIATGPFSLIYLGIGHDRVACVPGGATLQRVLELTSVTPWGAASADPGSLEMAHARSGLEIKGGAIVEAAEPIQPAPPRDLVRQISQAPLIALERLLSLVPESAQAEVESGTAASPEIRKAPALIARMSYSDWDSPRAVADARAAGEVFRNAVVAIRRLGGKVGPVEIALDGHRLLSVFSGTGRSEIERAAQCALELKGLGLSVALETGATFTGELGAGFEREVGALGEALDMAGKLLSVARLGDAVVGPEVRSQLWGFGIELLPTIRLDERGSMVPGLLLASPEPQALRARPRTSEASTALPSLIGREREMALIKQQGLLARGGRVAAVAILGESGVGKSAILDGVVSDWSSAGASAAVARCTFADSERPWALAGRLMRQLLRLPSDTDPDRAPDAVSRFDSRLSTVAPYAAVLLGAPGAATPEAVSELLEGIVAHRAADAPLLLAVDNAQYADPSSASALSRIARRLSNVPLLWMVAKTAHGQTEDWLAPLAPEALEILPLSRDAAVAVIRRLETGLSADAAQASAEAGGGNPFRMQSAARILLSGGKLSAQSDLPAIWTQGLEENPRLVAELIAVFGGARASVEVLYEAMREFDRHASGRDAVLAVEKRDLLERRLGKLRFRVRAVQEAIYARLDAERAKALHGAVGRALKMYEPESPAALFAFHFSRSDSLSEAIRSCMRAGEDALRAGALAEASALFGKAARAAEQSRSMDLCDALARQARTLARLGRFHEVLTLAERAVTAARAANRKRPLAEALASAAQAAMALDDLAQAQRLVAEAAEVAAWTRDVDLSIETYGLATAVFCAVGRLRDAVRFARQALRLAGSQDSPAGLAQARAALGAAAMACGHSGGAARELAEAQRLYSISGDTARSADAAVSRALALVSAQQPERAAHLAQQVLSTPDLPSATRGLALLALGLSHLDLRRLPEAQRVLGEARSHLPPGPRARGELYELLSRALQGSPSAAETITSMASSVDVPETLRAHALYAMARCAIDLPQGSGAAEKVAAAEAQARRVARDLLPPLANLRKRMATRVERPN